MVNLHSSIVRDGFGHNPVDSNVNEDWWQRTALPHDSVQGEFICLFTIHANSCSHRRIVRTEQGNKLGWDPVTQQDSPQQFAIYRVESCSKIYEADGTGLLELVAVFQDSPKSENLIHNSPSRSKTSLIEACSKVPLC